MRRVITRRLQSVFICDRSANLMVNEIKIPIAVGALDLSPSLPNKTTLEAAAGLVHEHLAPTPAYRWPLLDQRVGAKVWVKHENHLPVGAFKVRGGLTYLDALKKHAPEITGIISATRGNHGQSLAFAGRRYGISPVILVPEGNSVEKNAAMRAQGAELIVGGDDFQACVETLPTLAEERGLHRVPSFDMDLVKGVASYTLELLSTAPDIRTVYVPIGLGSGIVSIVAVREALGLTFDVVGVVSTGASAYARSFETGQAVSRPVTTKIADGMACRTPVPEALDLIKRHVARIVEVPDSAVKAAMKALYQDTHNVAEGAGAAALAALMQERERQRGEEVGIILCGGNVDADVFADVLSANWTF